MLTIAIAIMDRINFSSFFLPIDKSVHVLKYHLEEIHEDHLTIYYVRRVHLMDPRYSVIDMPSVMKNSRPVKNILPS